MNHSRILRHLTALTAAGVLAATVVGCSDQVQQVGTAGGGDSVTIGYPAWDECIASANIWSALLTEQGYSVDLKQLEIAAVYAGLAQGDIDIFACGVPGTQADYWDTFGEDFVDVGQWFDSYEQGIVVPDYLPYTSTEELAGQASEFGGQIIGIEAGAGLSQAAHGAAQEAYDLSGYTVVDGSTAAMLAALDRAIAAQEPIAVLLWEPHWAFSKYDIHLLDDPAGSFGEPDSYRVLVSSAFEGNAEIVDQLRLFHLTPDELQGLELEITEAGTGNEAAATAAWIEANRSLVEQWTEAR